MIDGPPKVDRLVDGSVGGCQTGWAAARWPAVVLFLARLWQAVARCHDRDIGRSRAAQSGRRRVGAIGTIVTMPPCCWRVERRGPGWSLAVRCVVRADVR